MPNRVTVDVVDVTDGDTLTVEGSAGHTEIVRLWGIDAPETSQPYGSDATAVARKVADGKRVDVELIERDHYGRVIGRVHVEGTTLGRTLARSGYAWHGRRYPTSPQLKENEQQARREGRGLWSQSDPTPPWRHRSGRPPAPSGKEVLKSLGWMALGAFAMVCVFAVMLWAA
jgi:endonuclease YncB( thermonuclease family)